jgi:ABC-2 type transport system permease protein
MRRILDITLKDLKQVLRDKQTFLFLLIMPVAFTLLFSMAFAPKETTVEDPRLVIGTLDLDGGFFNAQKMFAASDVMGIQSETYETREALKAAIEANEIAAGIVIPQGYSAGLLDEQPLAIEIIADPTGNAASLVQSDVMLRSGRALNTVRAARVISDVHGSGDEGFEAAWNAAETAWKNPPVVLESSSLAAEGPAQNNGMDAKQFSPGMMLQFALAGLLTAAQVIVNERKGRVLQRLLTTATSRVDILLGHYLSILTLIFAQFILLIVFGQLFLGLPYLAQPLATLIVALAAAICIAALGLLIGIFAKSNEQAIIFAMIPMFVFSGLGGAWMPLEFTGKAFQAIGHLSPVAWGMDGFKSILAGGQGLAGIWLPAAALLGYAVLFFALAVWKFRKSEEK